MLGNIWVKLQVSAVEAEDSVHCGLKVTDNMSISC